MNTQGVGEKQSCTECAQVIVLNHPLPSHVRCPRCGFKLKVADLVSADTPLLAVPSSAPPSSQQDQGRMRAVNTPAPLRIAPVSILEPEIDEPPAEPPFLEPIPSPLAAALAGAQGAARGLSSFGRWVLRACESADRVFAGRRLWLIASATSFAGASLALNRLLDNDTLAKVSTLSGIALLYPIWLMAFAFAGNLRDEGGQWRGRVVFQRLGAFWRGVVAEIETIGEAPTHIRWRLATAGFGALTLTVFAVANILTVFVLGAGDLTDSTAVVEATETLATWGWLGALLTGLVGIGWWRSSPATRVVETFDDSEAWELTSQLPPIVALYAGESAPSGDTFLHEMLDVLASWPARTWPTETDYQLALKRHMERSLPGVLIEREKRLGPSRSDGIADFVIADAIILELKKGFRRKTDIDRALGQMDNYSVRHPDKPAMLVIFEANAEDVLEASVTPRLRALHAQRAAVTVRMPVPKNREGTF